MVGEDVYIAGAGPIGLMAAMISKKIGARKVIISDISDSRLELARVCGADYTINASTEIDWPKVFKDNGMTEGVDVGLYMTGNQSAFDSMVDSMRPSGKIAFLGIPGKPFTFDFSRLIFKMLHIKGI